MALPKALRLKGHRTFDYIHKNSVKYYGKLMTIKIAKANREILISHNQNCFLENLKIAIAISKKVSKKAVERNRIRRILQDGLLQNLSKDNNHKPYWILVNLKINNLSNDEKSNGEKKLLDEFHYLIFKSGLFK